jgi:hypothetical protein
LTRASRCTSLARATQCWIRRRASVPGTVALAFARLSAGVGYAFTLAGIRLHFREECPGALPRRCPADRSRLRQGARRDLRRRARSPPSWRPTSGGTGRQDRPRDRATRRTTSYRATSVTARPRCLEKTQDAEEPAGMADRHGAEVPPGHDTAGHHDDHGPATPALVPPCHDLVGLRHRPRRQGPTNLASPLPVANEPERATSRPPRRSARRATPRPHSLGGGKLPLPKVDIDVRMNESLSAPVDHTAGARRGEDAANDAPRRPFFLVRPSRRCSASGPADLRRGGQAGPIRLPDGHAGGRPSSRRIENGSKTLNGPAR